MEENNKSGSLIKGVITSSYTNDPKSLNRAQVYIPSLHGSYDKNKVGEGKKGKDGKVSTYPWAQCRIIRNLSDIPKEGSTVWIMFEDNNPRLPVIMGIHTAAVTDTYDYYKNRGSNNSNKNNDDSDDTTDLPDYIGDEGKNTLQWPVPKVSYISSKYGNRFHPIKKVWKLHNGIDIAKSPAGKPIVAAEAGKVYFVNQTGYGGGYGTHCIIYHKDLKLYTLYAHMIKNSIKVKKNDEVKRGQVIGKMGSTGDSTGPHLHFTVATGSDCWSSSKNPLNYVKVP